MRTRRTSKARYTSLEICAGAGGQALGLEKAGFDHVGLVELDPDACRTLRANRPEWKVFEQDLRQFSGDALDERVDLLAGGVPCPPYSIAGRQLGSDDDRDLFPEVLRLASELNPRGLMIENVKGLLQAKFDRYRADLLAELDQLGYEGEWTLLTASDYGVPQLRPRSVLVALRKEEWPSFAWPAPRGGPVPTVGAVLAESMAANDWPGAVAWAQRASSIAPTLVGGSKKHGGADLGPTRAKQAWRQLGVDAHGVHDQVPGPNHPHDHEPKLTVAQAALIQGFPAEWRITGRKTAAYRQVGNAFPPPVAHAVASSIVRAWKLLDRK